MLSSCRITNLLINSPLGTSTNAFAFFCFLYLAVAVQAAKDKALLLETEAAAGKFKVGVRVMRLSGSSTPLIAGMGASEVSILDISRRWNRWKKKICIKARREMMAD